jgi:hypothetical protein
MFRSHSVAVLSAALWLLAVSSVVAEDKSPAKKPEPPAADDPFAQGHEGKPRPSESNQRQLRGSEAAIEQALAQPTEIEFVDTPLSDVIDYLKDHHRIEIQLDIKMLDDVGIGSDTPVTKRLKGISLRSALNLLLRELSLTWIIQDEMLLITTPEEAESRLTIKVLDVADLVVCRDSSDRPWDDYDTLIKMITSTVLPTTWEAAGGPGSIAPANLGMAKALVVSQTYHVHCQIAEVLAKVRNIAKKNPDGGPPRRDRPCPIPKTDKPPHGAKPTGGMGMF